jgi:hypothetical protein
MELMKKIGLVLLILFFLPAKVLAVDFYVSPDGNDNNPGTLEAPFETVDKARLAAREINQTEDTNIYLRGGIYELSRPVIFFPEDSGKNGFFVVYRNYPGETPVISGGKQIMGWRYHENGIWRVNIGTDLMFRSLYVNGRRAIRARSDGWITGAVRTSTGFAISDPRYAVFSNQSDIEVVDNTYWRHPVCGVKHITPTAIVMKSSCWDLMTVKTSLADKMFLEPDWLENAYELLDSPDEWYFNRHSGWLYYRPKAGESINDLHVFLPVVERLIEAVGTVSSPVHNLRFEGLVFSHTSWNGPSGPDGFAHRGGDSYLTRESWPTFYTPVYDNGPQIPGAVTFNYSNNIKFYRNIFLQIGSAGVVFGNGSQNIEFIGNHMTDILATAVRIGEVNNPWPTNEREKTLSIQISNNYIYRSSVENTGSCGIASGFSDRLVISHNEIT